MAAKASHPAGFQVFVDQETHVDALSASDHENTHGFPSVVSFERATESLPWNHLKRMCVWRNMYTLMYTLAGNRHGKGKLIEFAFKWENHL